MGSCWSVRIRADSPPRRDGLISRYVSTDGRDTSSRRSSSSAPPTPRGEGEILVSSNLKVFGFNDLRTATRNFRPDSVLGEGGFGSVFKGWVDENTFKAARPGTGMVIAVKRLNQESFQGHKEWLTEINFLGQLYHPNLVKLVGYCLEDEHRLLVYEFMPRGSLENHLFRRTAHFQPLSWNLRMKVALGAAKGLAYLHSPEARVIYRDFKSSNILLDSSYNAKLSDFGLAKDGPIDGKSHVSTRIMGTYGYAAPEYMATGKCSSLFAFLGGCYSTHSLRVLADVATSASARWVVQGHLTKRSDVYSFGVVLLEMLTGRRVLDKNLPHGEQNLVLWARPFLASKRRVLRVMDARIQGQYSPNAALKAAILAVKCLAIEPKYRPTMKEVVKALEQLQDTGSVKTDEVVRRRMAWAGDSSRKATSYPRPSHSPVMA